MAKRVAQPRPTAGPERPLEGVDPYAMREQTDRLKALHAMGYHADEIAREMGAELEQVEQWLRVLRVGHGTTTAYRAGCRCPACTAAHTRAEARRKVALQALTGSTADRHGMPWTAEDEAILDTHPPAEAARLLRRTYYAVKIRGERRRAERREVLKRQGK